MKLVLNALTLPLIGMAVFCVNQNLQADVVWNEAVDGDLSSNPATPTFVGFNVGANTIIGSLSEPDGDEQDFLTFTLGPNQFLTGLTLDAFSPEGVSFQGINSGTTSFNPEFATAGNFLGLEFVTHEMLGTDMLPLLAAGGYGSIGFTIPLGPGNYSYVIQELTPGEFRNYQITFHVIPEPSSVGLFCLAGLLLSTRRGRRS
jgi:hypothetical protein